MESARLFTLPAIRKNSFAVLLSLVVVLAPLHLSADDMIRVSAADNSSVEQWDNRYPSVSNDGQCVVFDSRNKLDRCYSQPGINDAGPAVFLYQRHSDRLSLVSLVDGSLHGVGSEGGVISADCSHLVFNLYETSGNPPKPDQVYWRQNTLLQQHTDHSANQLFVDHKICGETLAPGETRQYRLHSPGTVTLTSTNGDVGMTITAANDPSQVLCELNSAQTPKDQCTIDNNFSDGASVVVSSLGNTTAVYEIFLDGESDEGYASIQNGTKTTGSTPALAGIDISDDGRFVVFETSGDNLDVNDNNGQIDVYLHDTVTGTTSAISLGTSGQTADNDSRFPAISPQGGHIAFVSAATGLVEPAVNEGQQLYVYSSDAAPTIGMGSLNNRGEIANQPIREADISANGRFIAFLSDANNIVDIDGNGEYDDVPVATSSRRYLVYVRDTTSGTTEIASVGIDGELPAYHSYSPSISADGRYVAFATSAPLVPEDDNEVQDIYITDRQAGRIALASVSDEGTIANDSSSFPTLSHDGTWIVFQSLASNLTDDDANSVTDIFMRPVAGLFDNTDASGESTNQQDHTDEQQIHNDSDNSSAAESDADTGSGSLDDLSLLLLAIILCLKILKRYPLLTRFTAVIRKTIPAPIRYCE